jgi:hypothetical protein
VAKSPFIQVQLSNCGTLYVDISTNMLEHVTVRSEFFFFFYNETVQTDYMEKSLPEQLLVAYYRVHMKPPLNPILDQFNPVYICKCHFFNMKFNIILPYMIRSPK